MKRRKNSVNIEPKIANHWKDASARKAENRTGKRIGRRGNNEEEEDEQ